MKPTDTLIKSPTAEMIGDYFEWLSGEDDFDDVDLYFFEWRYQRAILLYNSFCTIKGIEPDREIYGCDCCTYESEQCEFRAKMVQGENVTLCHECNKFISKNIKPIDKNWSRNKLVTTKELTQCPVCFDDKECYGFFLCEHKCCFDCMIQSKQHLCSHKKNP